MIAARFGLIALIPAMFNLTIVPIGGILTVRLCTDDGQVNTVQVPLGKGGNGRDEQGICCAKGCHNGTSRKRYSAKN